MSNSNIDVRVATDATLTALNAILATLSKDTTLATLAKDTTLSAINTALSNIVTAINNQSSGVTDSNVTIQIGTSNIAGGSVYINNGQEPVLVSSLPTLQQ